MTSTGGSPAFAYIRRAVAILAIALVAAGVGYQPRQLRAAAPAIAFTRTFGGSSSDYPAGIAVDRRGYIYVTGETDSRDLPVTANAYQRSWAGAFVAKL